MKYIKIISDDYQGRIEVIRHACRGILIHDNKILLCYEAANDRYILPGGGVEDGETLEKCCARELAEETGIAVSPYYHYLEIEELFDVWKHVNHYFVCELIADMGNQHLTAREKQVGYTAMWLPLEDALHIFGKYEQYHATNRINYGLYRREFTALEEYVNMSALI